MLWMTFVHGGQPFAVDSPEAQSFQRQKDILMYLVPFATTVFGFYFGKAPAEAAAKRSRAEADDAKSKQEAAEGKATIVAGLASESIGLLKASAGQPTADENDLGKMGSRNVRESANALSAQADELRGRLQDVLNQGGHVR